MKRSVLLSFMRTCFSAGPLLALLLASCSAGAPSGDEAETPQTTLPMNATTQLTDSTDAPAYTASTPVVDVLNDPVFGSYGRLLLPVDDAYWSGTTLGSLRLMWYNDIRPASTVAVCNHLHAAAARGDTVFYNIYDEAERADDPAKRNTGLFFFRGRRGARFAVCNAGGAFAFVGAVHDSFPHALFLSRRGYNAFALIYRPGAQTACEDLSRAIDFIMAHAATLGVDTTGYSLWGGSAGARMAAWVGEYGTAAFGALRHERPAAVVMQYTGLSDYSAATPPTYACCGTADGIASWRVMQRRLEGIAALGTPTEFHAYRGLPHGFGLGIGTVAEGWADDALSFWEKQANATLTRINQPKR